jgi:hypothetical protein
MSALRHALRHAARLQESALLRSLAVAEPASACAPASQAQQVRRFVASSTCSSPTHIEDELYCRQRQLLVLGNRVPVLAPDSWVAPNAVVIGDVDLYDKVSDCVSSSFGALHLALASSALEGERIQETLLNCTILSTTGWPHAA